MIKNICSSIDNGRTAYIDIAKFLGIFLVIHNHLGLDYSNNILKIGIASFHMPLFFLLAGVVKSFSKADTALWAIIRKRFIGVMIPFYLWSFVFIDFKPVSLLCILYGSNLSISKAGGVGGSWYLPCFFVADILYEVSSKFAKKLKLSQFFVALVYFAIGYILNRYKLPMGYFMSFDVAFCGAAFIIIGDMLKKSQLIDKIYCLKLYIKIVCMFGAFCLCVVLALNNPDSYANEYGRLVMALGYYGNFALFILTSLFGSMGILFLSMIVESTRCTFIMEAIGRNTLCILLVQQIVIIYIEKIITWTSMQLNPILALGIAMIALIISHALSLIITYIVPNFKGRYIMIK